MITYIKKWILMPLFLLSCSLLLINVYGLFQDIRPQTFTNQDLRFINDQPLSYQETIAKLTKHEDESDIAFANRATDVIEKGLAHIHWEKYQPEKFNQQVPLWENYFLYFMGKFSGIPEYEKYHFADYKRSLKRGIGICGDASMVLSQVLNEHDIENKILTYPGHVVVAVNFSDNQSALLDADFGVSIPFDKDETKQNYQEIAQLYSEKGYPAGDRLFFEEMYQTDYRIWNGVKHFITKKYYFEKISYWLKWPLPIFMIFFSIFYLRKNSIKHS